MDDAHRGLTRLLASTARAHHEATGGVDEAWVDWYARHLEGGVDEFVGFSPSVDEIRDWLLSADEEHRRTDPDGRWPPLYASLILGRYSRRA